MDFVQYQKFLDNQWRQLEQRIQDDEDFQKAGKAKIQISEEFFYIRHKRFIRFVNNY